MTDYVLNLDVPDSAPTPAPIAPLAAYLELHAFDLALMIVFARYLLPDRALKVVCGSSDLWRMEVELSVRAVERLLARDARILDTCGEGINRPILKLFAHVAGCIVFKMLYTCCYENINILRTIFMISRLLCR